MGEIENLHFLLHNCRYFAKSSTEIYFYSKPLKTTGLLCKLHNLAGF